MKKKRVLIINAKDKNITEGEVSSLKDCQAIVGGRIERGHILDNGDEVYVNEEGLLSSEEYFFWIKGAHQPFAGNGYIIGSVTPTGNNRSATSEIKDLEIHFLKALNPH